MEEAPQGSCHERLAELTVEEHLPHLLGLEEMHLQVLRAVEMLMAGRLHPHSQEAVTEVGHRTGIGREVHQMCPLAAAVACLLKQLTTGSLLGTFPLLHHSRHYLIRRFAQSMPVLPLQYHPSVAGERYHIDPIGVFQHIILVLHHPIRQPHHIPACREPRALYQILRGESLPTDVLFHNHLLPPLHQRPIHYIYTRMREKPPIRSAQANLRLSAHMGLISQEKRAHAHAHCPATLTGTTHRQEKHGQDDKKRYQNLVSWQETPTFAST